MKILCFCVLASALIASTIAQSRIVWIDVFDHLYIISFYSIVTVSSLQTKDICPSRTGTIKCDPNGSTNFTPFVVEGLYGISTIQSDICEYK